MKVIVVAALLMAMPTIVVAETEAEALLRIQRRNAGVVEGLVDQTLEYQHGHALRVEAAKQQERATAERNERWKAEEEQHAAQKASRLSDEDQSTIDSLNRDIRSKATEKGLTSSQREHASRALRDEQRQIYGKAGMEAPIAPEPPPRPIVHQTGGDTSADRSPKPPVTYRPTYDGTGNLRGSDGSRLRPDAFGNYR